MGNITAKWQRLVKGIMARCTVSVVLFIAAMNMMLKSVEIQCRGLIADDGIKPPPCRAFMYDITVMAQSITSTRWILKALEETANWAQMFFKLEKSRSLAVEKGTSSSKASASKGSASKQFKQNLSNAWESTMTNHWRTRRTSEMSCKILNNG